LLRESGVGSRESEKRTSQNCIFRYFLPQDVGRAEIIPLTTEDYQEVIEQMVNLNLMGGGIYDALIAHIAIKNKIDQIVTLNPKDFMRLGNQITLLVKIP
jgi:predicted nucleic acid-binding protein